MRATGRGLKLGASWFVGGLAVALVLALTVPLAFSARPLTVLSGSMEPALKTGDVIVVQRKAPEWGSGPGTSSPSASRGAGG